MRWSLGRAVRACAVPDRAHLLVRPLQPWRWFHRNHCWYQLDGHASDASITCPECGTKLRPRDLRRDGRTVRTGRAAVVMLVLASSSATWRSVRGEGWVAILPDLPLVMMSHTQWAEYRMPLRREVLDRADSGTLSGLSSRWLAEGIVKDLRDDQVKWNASEAMSALAGLWPHSEPILDQELEVGDVQSRRLAWSILKVKRPEPTPMMLATAGDLLDQQGWTGERAALYLNEWIDRSEDVLIEAMQSRDRRARLRAAVVVGFSGNPKYIDQAVPILAKHLADNRISGDARAAAPALYRFGDAVLPALRAQLDQHDEQARAVMLHIIERIEHPEKTKGECAAPLPKITGVVHDPLTQVSLWLALDGT